MLVERLGSGGMGEVFRARRKSGGDEVVIKRLHETLTQQIEFVRRFRHEATLARTISSPHVAQVLDQGVVAGTPYIAMAFIDGWSMAALIEKLTAGRRSPTIPLVVDTIEGALFGLTALHEARDPRTGEGLGIVHRDISPKNIIVDRTGCACLIDLGLGASKLKDWQTATGRMMGTVGYMAPEQVRAQTIDQRSDLYALGTVLFEMLTMERYIPLGSLGVVLKETATPRYRPPSSIREDVPEALDAVLERALAVRPEDRFQDARAFHRAMRDAVPEPLGATTVLTEVRTLVEEEATQTSPPALLESTTRRRPQRLPVYTILAVAAGMLIGTAIIVTSRPEPTVTPAPEPTFTAKPGARPQADLPRGGDGPTAVEAEGRRAAPATPSPPKRPAAKSKRRTKVTKRRAASATPTERPLRDRIRALHQRAVRARAKAADGSTDAEALDRLVQSILLEAGSTDEARARSRIRSLEAQLERFEKPSRTRQSDL